MRESIVNERHNKHVFLRLERQTTTFKDRFSLFLMIFKINILKISVYIDDIRIWATMSKQSKEWKECMHCLTPTRPRFRS